MMSPRRVSQRLSQSGDEATPLSSTQSPPHIDEGHKIEAFNKIEEVEQQHVATTADTSAGAVMGSSQNGRGGSQ
jgi:hypothetical protein